MCKEYPSAMWHAVLKNYLKNKGIAVAAVNYRLNPKVQSPVYVEDAAAAVVADDGEGNAAKVGIVGDDDVDSSPWLVSLAADDGAEVIPFVGSAATMVVGLAEGLSVGRSAEHMVEETAVQTPGHSFSVSKHSGPAV